MMNNKSLLELNTRRKIFEAIKNNPGIHFRNLSRFTDIPITTLKYHLRVMKKYGIIKEEPHNGYLNYFLCKEIGRKEKRLLNLLGKKSTREIILLFLCRYCLTCREISRELELHPNTVDFHLKKMKKLGVIEPAVCSKEGVIIFDGVNTHYVDRQPVCNETIYKLSAPIAFYWTIITYKKSIMGNNEILQSIINYLDEERVWPPPKKHQTFKSAVGSVEDVFKELIPCPFCA